MMSPISCMCPSKLRSSNKVMTLAVWFIWSIESSIDVIRSLYVAAVEGGYERLSQRGHHLPCYLICFVLAFCYLLAAAEHIIISPQQSPKCTSGSERDFRMASEEIEESFLFWHQGPKPA